MRNCHMVPEKCLFSMNLWVVAVVDAFLAAQAELQAAALAEEIG